MFLLIFLLLFCKNIFSADFLELPDLFPEIARIQINAESTAVDSASSSLQSTNIDESVASEKHQEMINPESDEESVNIEVNKKKEKKIKKRKSKSSEQL